MKRSATALWQGTGKEGQGHLTTQSTVLNKTQYSYKSRFEEGIGTNPEELIAAAHAGCFTMKMSFLLSGEGFTPEELETTCTISLVDGVLSASELELKATVNDVTEEKFAEMVKNASENCIISKALNLAISVKYTLNQSGALPA